VAKHPAKKEIKKKKGGRGNANELFAYLIDNPQTYHSSHDACGIIGSFVVSGSVSNF
jgi:hypothetical protein